MKVIKVVNLIPINESKTQILVVKKKSEDINDDKWVFPGESIKKNETENSAIIRIINSQINCKISNLKKFKKTEITIKQNIIKSEYLTGIISGKIELDSLKYSDYKWVGFNSALLEIDFGFNQKKIATLLLKEYKKFN